MDYGDIQGCASATRPVGDENIRRFVIPTRNEGLLLFPRPKLSTLCSIVYCISKMVVSGNQFSFSSADNSKVAI